MRLLVLLLIFVGVITVCTAFPAKNGTEDDFSMDGSSTPPPEDSFDMDAKKGGKSNPMEKGDGKPTSKGEKGEKEEKAKGGEKDAKTEVEERNEYDEYDEEDFYDVYDEDDFEEYEDEDEDIKGNGD